MASFKVHTCLIPPGKNQPSPAPINGKELAGDGALFDLLGRIFHSPREARDFEVIFRKSADGTQHNEVRSAVIAYQQTGNLESALKIASRLQSATDRRSGNGLLFLMTGQHATKYRTVISRFPANEGILAEVREEGLDVAFLEQVFIRQLSAYKSMMLEDNDPVNQYWNGLATDHQAGSAPEHISNYWLNDFLDADFLETPKRGTLRLAIALKKAVKSTSNQSVKDEIVSAVSLAPTALNGKPTSIDLFCEHFGLSKDAQDTIKKQLDKPLLSSKIFAFDPSEFKKQVPYRSVELENGAILKAPSDEFSKVFKVEEIGNGKVRYSTESKVADLSIVK